MGNQQVVIMELREVFDGKCDNYFNCIYQIRNKINQKSYVGQARDLLRRFVFDNKSHYNTLVGYESHHQVLYRAIQKYSIDNFEVLILDHNLDLSDMRSKERYWVRELHTCIYDPLCHGYNMTWGGEDCSQLHTPSARSKAKQTVADQYNGDPYGMMHTKEVMDRAIKRSLESRELIYGTKSGALNRQDSMDARTRTRWVKICNLILKSIELAKNDGLVRFNSIGEYEYYRMPGSTQVHRRKLAHMIVTTSRLMIPGSDVIKAFFNLDDLEPYYSELASDQCE